MLRNCACLVIAHMVDATQLCLSCHCTHGGCYATVLVLSLHTWWMLRNCACLVIAHMVDATQLCLSCHCTHGGCYATVLVLSLHTWWMLRNCTCLVIAHMVDATHRRWQPSFGGISLVVFVQNERAAEVAWRTGQIGPKGKQCYKIEKKRLFFGGGFLYAQIPLCILVWRQEPMEKMGRNQHMNQQTIHGIQHPCSISCIFNKMPC